MIVILVYWDLTHTNMSINVSLCNAFAKVIDAVYAIGNGANVNKVLSDLTTAICDEVTPSELDTIHSSLLKVEEDLRRGVDVQSIYQYSVIGTDQENHQVLTPTSEHAFKMLEKMGFKSHVEGVTYDASRGTPTIIIHLIVAVDTVIPGSSTLEI